MKRYAVSSLILAIIGGSFILMELQSCKHDTLMPSGEPPSSTTTNPSPTTSLDGSVLYSNYCAGCHGLLGSSSKRGATVAQIQNGMSTVTGMKPLSSLTSAQIQAIANALANSINTPTPAPSTDGATLYANNCAGCHGALASSAKRGATVAQIQNGISAVSGMKSLSTMTAAQIQAIANALATTSPVPVTTDGATLYANNCASCHGPLASSSKIGATSTRINSAITTVSGMKSLSSLTASQIQSIADVLTSTPMPTDGPTLYSINCSSCHGQLASSQVGGSSVSKIQNAISEKSQMRYLSTLTVTQLQAISSALANVKGGGD